MPPPWLSNFLVERRKRCQEPSWSSGGVHLMVMVTVRVSKQGVLFENLESHDPEVVGYFAELPVESLGDLAVRAMTVGVLGLRAMGTAGRMEIVEKEFLKLSQRFAFSLEAVEKSLTDRV